MKITSTIFHTFGAHDSVGRVSRALLTGAVLLLAAGCAMFPRHLEREPLPPDAPNVSTLLADLAANDAALQSFRARGAACVLKSPDVSRSFNASLSFLAPDRIHIVGNHPVLPKRIFELTAVGSEFLMEFPGDREPYYRFDGDHAESADFAVSPADIIREIFFPEQWERVPRRHVHIAGYSAADGAVEVEIGPKRAIRRRLKVQRVSGPLWVLVKSELLDEQGMPIAVTIRDRYRQIGTMRFPEFIRCDFPNEKTWFKLDFDMSRFEPNIGLADNEFVFNWRPSS